jgi:hypothetical protein
MTAPAPAHRRDPDSARDAQPTPDFSIRDEDERRKHDIIASSRERGLECRQSLAHLLVTGNQTDDGAGILDMRA